MPLLRNMRAIKFPSIFFIDLLVFCKHLLVMSILTRCEAIPRFTASVLFHRLILESGKQKAVDHCCAWEWAIRGFRISHPMRNVEKGRIHVCSASGKKQAFRFHKREGKAESI